MSFFTNYIFELARVRDSSDATARSSLLCRGSKSLPLAVERFTLPNQEGDRSERVVLSPLRSKQAPSPTQQKKPRSKNEAFFVGARPNKIVKTT